MKSISFYGVTIPKTDISKMLLDTEFEDSVVTVKEFNDMYCLYYKDRCKIDNNGDYGLDRDEKHHFVNRLERVRSDEVYNSYQDNMQLHTIELKLKPKKRVKLKLKLVRKRP